MKFLRNFCCLLFQVLQLRHNFWTLPIGFVVRISKIGNLFPFRHQETEKRAVSELRKL